MAIISMSLSILNDCVSCDYTTDYWFIKFEHLSVVWSVYAKNVEYCTNGAYTKMEKSQPTTTSFFPIKSDGNHLKILLIWLMEWYPE